jgi:hypothetical protein
VGQGHRVTPTQKPRSGLLVSSRSQAWTLGTQIGQIGGEVMIWPTDEPRERPTNPGWTNRCVVLASRPGPSGTGHGADAAAGNAAPRRRRPQPRRRDSRGRRCARTGVSRMAGQIANGAYLDSPSRRLGLIEYSVVDRMQLIHSACAGESIIRTPTGSPGTHSLWSRGIAALPMSRPTRRSSAISDPRQTSHAAMSFRPPPSHAGQPWRSAWGLH